MENTIKIIVAAVLLLLAVEDYRKKEIPIWQMILLFSVAIIGRGLLGVEWFAQLLGVSIGLCMLGISFLTKQKIGYADSFSLLAMGFFLGAERLLWAMLLASLVLCVVSGFLLLRKKASLQSTLPYLPALWIGFIVV